MKDGISLSLTFEVIKTTYLTVNREVVHIPMLALEYDFGMA